LIDTSSSNLMHKYISFLEGRKKIHSNNSYFLLQTLQLQVQLISTLLSRHIDLQSTFEYKFEISPCFRSVITS